MTELPSIKVKLQYKQQEISFITSTYDIRVVEDAIHRSLIKILDTEYKLQKENLHLQRMVYLLCQNYHVLPDDLERFHAMIEKNI